MEHAHTDHASEPKNLVICCDGTGNEISENISNVLKLYRCLRKTERTRLRQMVLSDPPVGSPIPGAALRSPGRLSDPGIGTVTLSVNTPIAC